MRESKAQDSWKNVKKCWPEKQKPTIQSFNLNLMFLVVSLISTSFAA